jgi:hypothetical protein
LHRVLESEEAITGESSEFNALHVSFVAALCVFIITRVNTKPDDGTVGVNLIRLN